MTLCEACKLASDAWLDFRVHPVLKIASGASRDDTTAGVADGLRGRFEEWRNTVRFQQGLIRRICEDKHQDQGIADSIRTPETTPVEGFTP